MKRGRVHDACGMPWTMHTIGGSERGRINWVCPDLPQAPTTPDTSWTNRPRSGPDPTPEESYYDS